MLENLTFVTVYAQYYDTRNICYFNILTKFFLKLLTTWEIRIKSYLFNFILEIITLHVKFFTFANK